MNTLTLHVFFPSFSLTTKYKRIDASIIISRATHRAGMLIIKTFSTTRERGLRQPTHSVSFVGTDVVSLGTRKNLFGSEFFRFIVKLDSCSSSFPFLFVVIISFAVLPSEFSKSMIWISSQLGLKLFASRPTFSEVRLFFISLEDSTSLWLQIFSGGTWTWGWISLESLICNFRA